MNNETNSGIHQPQQTDGYAAFNPSYFKSFIGAMTASNVIWIFIIIYQFIVGVPSLLIGYGFTMLFCAVWNLIGCIKFSKFLKIVKKYPTVENAQATYFFYQNSLTSSWIFFFVNLFLGGFFGAVACGFDLILIYNAKAHKSDFGIME